MNEDDKDVFCLNILPCFVLFFFLTKTYCHVALSFHESLYVKETGSLILEQMILNIYIYN